MININQRLGELIDELDKTKDNTKAARVLLLKAGIIEITTLVVSERAGSVISALVEQRLRQEFNR